MAVNKYLWIKSRVLYISILLSVYPLGGVLRNVQIAP